MGSCAHVHDVNMCVSTLSWIGGIGMCEVGLLNVDSHLANEFILVLICIREDNHTAAVDERQDYIEIT